MSDHHPPGEATPEEPEDLTITEAPPAAAPAPLPRPTVDGDGLIRSHTRLSRRDDVIMAADDDDDAEYQTLRPAEGLSPAARRALTADPIPLTVEEEPERPLMQFTMAELLWLMSFLSVGFAVMYYLPSDKVAGVLGLLALLGQGMLMRFPPENRHVRLAATVLLIMYACAAFVAFVQHV